MNNSSLTLWSSERDWFWQFHEREITSRRAPVYRYIPFVFLAWFWFSENFHPFFHIFHNFLTVISDTGGLQYIVGLIGLFSHPVQKKTPA